MNMTISLTDPFINREIDERREKRKEEEVSRGDAEARRGGRRDFAAKERKEREGRTRRRL